MTYKVLSDYDNVDLENGEIIKFACCDCGLIHNICFVRKGRNGIQFSLVRNKRATATRRHHMKKNLKGIFNEL